MYRRYGVGLPASPFTNDFKCYAGSQWITGNSKVAGILVASRRVHNNLFYFYAQTPTPDESYCQTILCNTPGLLICNDNKRYADWSRAENHPKELGDEDLKAVLASQSHFARKFSLGKSDGILDVLARMLF